MVTLAEFIKQTGWLRVITPPLIQIPDAGQLVAKTLRSLFGDNACLELRAPTRDRSGRVITGNDGHTVTHNVYRKVTEWLIDNGNRGLLCYGTCGLGKTVLCGVVIPRIIHLRLSKVVYCYKATELKDKYKDIMKHKYVMIDDIGQEPPAKDYGENLGYVFSQIVDNAEANGNLLILTTNLSLAKLRDKYGDRTIDRLKALTTQVYFEGTSKRK